MNGWVECISQGEEISGGGTIKMAGFVRSRFDTAGGTKLRLIILGRNCPNVNRPIVCILLDLIYLTSMHSGIDFNSLRLTALQFGSLRVMKSVAGKGEAKCHSLPVVAMGSIPHIYLRVSFSHRATTERLPRTRSRESCFSSPLKNTELFHAKQTKFMKRPIAQLIIVGGPLALEFHATESPANPRVKLLEEPATSREAGGKEVRRALKYSIQVLDDQLGVEVMMPHRQLPHLVFEFLQGLRPHAARARREHEPKEGVTLAKGSNACLLSAQLQTECGQDLPHKVQRAFRLGIRVAND